MQFFLTKKQHFLNLKVLKKKQAERTTAVCSNWGFGLYLKFVLCLEDWFLIYSFGLSNPQLQQATGVGGKCLKPEIRENLVKKGSDLIPS